MVNVSATIGQGIKIFGTIDKNKIISPKMSKFWDGRLQGSLDSYKKWLLSFIDDEMNSQILVVKALPAE